MRHEIYDPSGQLLSVEQLPVTLADLLAALADQRWQVETGGCPWNGHVIQTDRDSQAKLIAEFVAIGADLRADPSPWKFAGGFAIVSNADMLSAIATARAHVQAAFAKEAELAAGIAAGTVTTLEAIAAAAWPPNA